MWSRDERRENRKVMRDQAQRADIQDSVSSNHVDRQYESAVENSSEYPSLGRRKYRKPSSTKWCRRKEGREHTFVLLETRKYRWSPIVHVCSVCGKKKYDWPRR